MQCVLRFESHRLRMAVLALMLVVLIPSALRTFLTIPPLAATPLRLLTPQQPEATPAEASVAPGANLITAAAPDIVPARHSLASGPGSAPASPSHPTTTATSAPRPTQRLLRPSFSTIAVIGERHSGTNLVFSLLDLNLDRGFHTILSHFTTHKHYLQPVPARPSPDTLVVMCVRNVYDWAAAMQRVCYCCERRSTVGTLDVFVTAPFQATDYGGPTSPTCPNRDRNIFAGGQPFHNLMDMRQWKLRNHLNTSNWAGGHELVRVEELRNPEAAVAWLRGLARRHILILGSHAAGNRSSNSSSSALARAVSPLSGKVLGIASQEDAEVVPILRDARPWIAKPFEAQARSSKSVYLNRSLLLGPGQVAAARRARMRTINALLDESIERAVGYEVLWV